LVKDLRFGVCWLVGRSVGWLVIDLTHRFVSDPNSFPVQSSNTHIQATKAAVQTAADVFGIPMEVDNNGGIHESAAIVQRNFKGATIDTGMRMGTFMAYLRPALAKQPKVYVCGGWLVYMIDWEHRNTGEEEADRLGTLL
jgi:hypothetical protein